MSRCLCSARSIFSASGVSVVAAHLDLVRPGGLALLNVPNRFSPMYRGLMATAKARGKWVLGTEVPFSGREMQRLARACGGRPLRPIYCGGLEPSARASTRYWPRWGGDPSRYRSALSPCWITSRTTCWFPYSSPEPAAGRGRALGSQSESRVRHAYVVRQGRVMTVMNLRIGGASEVKPLGKSASTLTTRRRVRFTIARPAAER